MTCIAYSRLKVVDFIDRCYYKETFQKANGEYIVHPIHDPSYWPPGVGTVPGAPDTKRGAGRPQLVRRRDRQNESAAVARPRGVLQCSKCGGWGHNARTCGRIPARRMKADERRAFEESKAANPTTVNKTKKRAAGVSQSQPPMATRRRTATSTEGQSSSQPAQGATGVSSSQPSGSATGATSGRMPTTRNVASGQGSSSQP